MKHTHVELVWKLSLLALIGREFWLPYSVTLSLVIASTILSALAPLLFGKIIDGLTQGYNGSQADVLLLVIVYLLIQLASSGLKAISNYVAASRSETISHYLRTSLTERIFHRGANHSAILNEDRGKTLSLFSRDIESLWDLFGFAILDIIASSIMIFTLCIVVFSINDVLGIIIIAISAVFSIAFYLNGHRVRTYFAAASPKFDRMIGFINSALSGYETIVSFRAQRWANELITRKSRDVTELANRAHLRSTTFTFITSTVNLCGLLLVWLLCLPSLLQQGPAYVEITLGQFLAVLAYFAMIMSPLENISGSAKAITKGMVSIERLSSFLRHSHEPNDQPQTSGLSVSRANSPETPVIEVSGLECEGVSDAATKPILNGLSFSVAHGQMIGLAGESGSGKSTLLRALGRLAEPSGGEISYFGTTICSFPEDEFRQKVTYVPQSAALFPVNFRQNITLVERDDQNSDDLREAATAASAAAFVDRFDDHVDMERSGLSGGEAQRLSLARAFFRESSILLVDEPTSALDFTNSVAVADSLRAAARRGAVVVASHDKHVLERCSYVLLLTDGAIAARGSHFDLDAKSSLYRSIISSQGDNRV
ncbi:ABC-type multidrug transport system fused ATPase/permease subunit [Ciceribacter lividus]|uniref:ABC-type multidrug transport system fused ATPase/permease subunit n=1 Tax=Ciceribacter lividus TaxID=1197950 RepID=A0A6I7HKI1_9HYPH|nr:ABC transporter ATP-binding protein [Ciceribacter lividus]RCW23342.1 ABC-type multidrug transport system fused ATPase/permease subunit [Ciceribacter lividus]